MNPFRFIKIRYALIILIIYTFFEIFLINYLNINSDNALIALTFQLVWQIILLVWMIYELTRVNKYVDTKISDFFNDKNYYFSKIFLIFLFISLFFSNILSNLIIQFMPDFIQNFINANINEYVNSSVFNNTNSIWISFLQFLTIVILAPVVEEFFYRGFIINRFSVKFGVRWAVFLSSTFFAIGHGDIISAFIKGYAFSIIYLKTKSLKIPIIFHFINNLIAFIIFKTLENYQIDNISFPNYIAYIMTFIIIGSFVILINFFYMNRVKDEKESPFEIIFDGVDNDVQNEQ